MKTNITDEQPTINAFQIGIEGDLGNFTASLEKISETNGRFIFRLRLTSDEPSELLPLTLKWKFPNRNVKGVWTTNALHEKRLRADWEPPSVESRISVDAPVLCLFSHTDTNVHAFACADVINTLKLAAPVREEDNRIYCQIHFFSEKMPFTECYETAILIDTRPLHFSETLWGISAWWASFEHLQPMKTFESAKAPLYSTWYSYHQSISVDALLNECRKSATLGYQLIIVDDGWQTKDSSRGYDYTGDWQADRIPNMAEFVAAVHRMGMKVMVWYSVPFCGVKSKAYQGFKGKFLTENHRWAPVFDPRYPEVRDYLIDTYTTALQNWNLDGFKLDFIDDFKVYPETVLTKENGRDYSSVNEAVDRLMSDVAKALQAIKPDILIEFRQKYIGPAMRKYGNMFRAFDCPNDSLTNRIRTTDVKLLCGSTAVHSDMFTWHREEPVEIAALQMANILFSVPQLSVRMDNLSEDYLKMINFYTQYWLENQAILLDGTFRASAPLANYPVLSATASGKVIYGVYENVVVEITKGFPEVDMVNGKAKPQITFQLSEALGKCRVQIFNCMGETQAEYFTSFKAGFHVLEVPPCGILCLEAVS